MKTTIFWCRRILYLPDDPTLLVVVEAGQLIIPVDIENSQQYNLSIGSASRYWLHHAWQ